MLNELIGNFLKIELVQLIIVCVSFVSVCATFGYKWNDRLNPQTRQSIRRRLQDAFQPKKNMAALFIPFFDRVFNTSIRRRPSIMRSVVASSISLSVVVVVWTFRSASSNFSLEDLIDEFSDLLSAVGLAVLAVGMNVFTDFLSLWETRLVLCRMAAARRKVQVAICLLLDLFLSLLTYACGLFLVSIITQFFVSFLDASSVTMGGAVDAWWQEVSLLVGNKGWMLCGGSRGDIIGIFLYTTLLTSIWVWVFMLGISLWPLLRRVMGWLDSDRQPVGVVMTLGGLTIGSFMMILFYVLRLLKSGC